MRFRDVKKLYTTEYRIDPDTGKERPTMRYIGPMHTLERPQRRSALLRSLAGLALGAAAFAVAGLTTCWAQLCWYVAPWFMLCLLPLFYLLLGTIKLLRLKEQFTEIDRADSFGYVRMAGLGLMVLGGAWAISAGIFLLTNQLDMTMTSELVFLGCGGVAALSGLLSFTVRFAGNKKEAAEAAPQGE